jgi:hypothetical protein
MTYKEQTEGFRKLAGLLDEMDTFLQERGAYFCGKRIFTPGEFNIYADLKIALQAAPYPPQ